MILIKRKLFYSVCSNSSEDKFILMIFVLEILEIIGIFSLLLSFDSESLLLIFSLVYKFL